MTTREVDRQLWGDFFHQETAEHRVHVESVLGAGLDVQAAILGAEGTHGVAGNSLLV